LYQDVYNPWYYDEFVEVLRLNDTELFKETMTDESSAVNQAMMDLMSSVYDELAPQGICGGSSSKHQMCSFSNLTNTQWLELAVFGEDHSYVDQFRGLTHLEI